MSIAAEICSRALAELGDQPISSLAEQLPRARTCAAVYAHTRDSLLRAHPWNCCTKRVVLSPEVGVPAFSWKHQFTRPQDWLRTIQVGYEGQPIPYRMEGRHILANASSLPLVYIWRNEDEDSWDGALVELMTMAIKSRIAYAITKSSSERDMCLAEYNRALNLAKAVDGQDDPPEHFNEDSDLIQARRGFRGVR